MYFVFNGSFRLVNFSAIFSLPFSEQTGARSLRTSKFIPDVPFHVYYFVQVVWNANDHKSRRSGEEILDHQNLSSKFIFPRGFSARRLDYLGNCGVRTNVGVGLLHMYRCHRCTAKNSSFIVMRAFRFVGQHYCGLVFMLTSSAAAVLPCASRLDSRSRNKRLRKQYGSCGRPRNNERGYFLVALPAIWSINLTSYCRLSGTYINPKALFPATLLVILRTRPIIQPKNGLGYGILTRV